MRLCGNGSSMGMVAPGNLYGVLFVGAAELLTLPLWAREAASDTRVSAAVTTSATYTDNADFEPNGDSELLLTVTPSISLRQQGRRSSTGIDYAISGQLSVFDESVDLIHNLDAFNNLELVEDTLFIESAAAISQEVVDSEAGVPLRQGDRGNNLATVQSYSTSPMVRFRIGSFAVSETRGRVGYVISDSESLDDELELEASTHLSSGPDFSRFSWDLSAMHEVDDPGGADERTVQTYELATETVVDRRLSLLANIGYEDFEDSSLVEPPQGVFWSAGFHARPGPKLDLTATYGRRFDGNDVFVDLTYRASARATLRAQYEQGLVTDQDVFLDGLSFIGVDEDGNLIDIRTGELIDPTEDFFGLSNDTFHRDLGTVQFDLTGRRDSYSIDVSYEKRDFESGSSDETVWSGSLSWTRRLSREVTASLRSEYDRVEFEDDGRVDNYFTVGGVLTRRFNDTLYGSLSYSWRLLNSSDPAEDAAENALTVSLTKTF